MGELAKKGFISVRKTKWKAWKRRKKRRLLQTGNSFVKILIRNLHISDSDSNISIPRHFSTTWFCQVCWQLKFLQIWEQNKISYFQQRGKDCWGEEGQGAEARRICSCSQISRAAVESDQTKCQSARGCTDSETVPSGREFQILNWVEYIFQEIHSSEAHWKVLCSFKCESQLF